MNYRIVCSERYMERCFMPEDKCPANCKRRKWLHITQKEDGSYAGTYREESPPAIKGEHQTLCVEAYLERCIPSDEKCKDCKRFSPIYLTSKPSKKLDIRKYNPITLDEIPKIKEQIRNLEEDAGLRRQLQIWDEMNKHGEES